ncbi:MAG: hypothetical protein M1818_006440 [Claussenomyces sp. TS43310]|nr:MAG: hypothetical protein M1818_006440 [Claussenomyces sp. TS43310]
MAAVQLSFTLRTSSSVKTVHLLGSWDNYAGQLPLAKNRESSKAGAWKGTFRFQGNTLKAGQRYWYYYIIDGYHVSHDPAQDHTTEPTTGRALNILDVPSDKSTKSSKSSSSSKISSSSKSSSSTSSSSKHTSSKSSKSSSSSKHSSTSRREARRETSVNSDIPKGRPLSVSQIVSPKPLTPYATKTILETEYGTLNSTTVAELTSRFRSASLKDDPYDSDPPSSTGSSLSSRSDASSPSSISSSSDYSNSSSCSCERYGITRNGDRVKLDCGGSRCGYSDADSCCSSEGEEYVPRSARRQGIIVRQ